MREAYLVGGDDGPVGAVVQHLLVRLLWARSCLNDLMNE